MAVDVVGRGTRLLAASYDGPRQHSSGGATATVGLLTVTHCATTRHIPSLSGSFLLLNKCQLRVLYDSLGQVACGALSQADITPEQSTHLLELIRWLVCERGCAIHSELRDLRSVQGTDASQ